MNGPARWAARSLALGAALCLQAAGEPLSVVTWNIYGGRGHMAEADLSAIADVLRRLDPDLAALQEVDRGTRRAGRRDVSAEIGKLLGLHSAFGPSIPLSGGEYGNALLSRWPLTQIRSPALPSSPNREPRSMVIAHAAVPTRHGGPVWLVSTHFDHQPGDTDRLPQARALMEEVEKAGMPVLLGGDFNCAPESNPFRVLSGQMMDTRCQHPRPTYPSDGPRKNIDGILAYPRDGWRVVEARAGDEIFPDDPEWQALLQRASDHLPVLVVLERTRGYPGGSGVADGVHDGIADRVHDAR